MDSVWHFCFGVEPIGRPQCCLEWHRGACHSGDKDEIHIGPGPRPVNGRRLGYDARSGGWLPEGRRRRGGGWSLCRPSRRSRRRRRLHHWSPRGGEARSGKSSATTAGFEWRLTTLIILPQVADHALRSLELKIAPASWDWPAPIVLTAGRQMSLSFRNHDITFLPLFKGTSLCRMKTDKTPSPC
jgi:hypothetical protein